MSVYGRLLLQDKAVDLILGRHFLDLGKLGSHFLAVFFSP
jgi:hypothetical protein